MVETIERYITNLEQRTKVFEIVRNTALKNVDKVSVISSDHSNLSFAYEDDDWEILYYYNQTTGDVVQISLYNKKLDESVKFDSGDYMWMKNRGDMLDLIDEIHETIFLTDYTNTEDMNLIDKILGL